jgi:catechol 2,3-dioxygenase-like lactoylglutathione lyase family enzyme
MAGLHHAAVFISDPDRSVRFYCDLLGLVENGRTTLDAVGIEQIFLSAGERQADIVLARRLDGVGPPAAMREKRELFHLAYELPPDRAFADFVDDVRRRGITVVAEPMEHPTRFDGSGTRDAIYVLDPDGYVLEVTKDR